MLWYGFFCHAHATEIEAQPTVANTLLRKHALAIYTPVYEHCRIWQPLVHSAFLSAGVRLFSTVLLSAIHPMIAHACTRRHKVVGTLRARVCSVFFSTFSTLSDHSCPAGGLRKPRERPPTIASTNF